MRFSAASSSRSWSALSRSRAARRPRGPRPRSASASRTNAPSARPSSIGRPTASPCQNGSLPGTPGAGETVTRSWPISSIRQLARPERDHLADPALVDHLLVELADPPAGRPRLADHEDAVQPAVRDRAAARDRDDAGVAAALDDVRDAVPRDARLQLRELVADG